MSDVAALGFQIDSTPVETARSRLQGMAASAGAVDQALARMTAAQNQTNRLLADHGRALDDINSKTSSYVTTLAKLATAGAAVTIAWGGMNRAMSDLQDGMRRQVTTAESLSSALRNLAVYGPDAFRTMDAGAVAAQRSMSMLAASLGTTASTLASFRQSMSTFGATPAQSAGAIGTLQAILSGTDAGAMTGRNTLAQLGVATSGSPDVIARAVVDRLQHMRAGQERNALANRLLGTDAASMVLDSAARPLALTDLDRSTSSLRDYNALLQRQSDQRRAEVNQNEESFLQRMPFLSMWSTTQRARFAQNRSLAENQFLGFDRPDGRILGGVLPSLGSMWRGATTFGRSLLAYGLGGGDAGGAHPGLVAQPGFFNPAALDAGTPPPINFAGGFSLLAGAGMGGPLAAQSATDTAQALIENQTKLGISTEDLTNALALLTRHMEDAADPFAALTRQAAVEGSVASASRKGPYAAATARIRATAGQMIGVPDWQRQEYINAQTSMLDSGYTRSANESMYSEHQQSGAMISQINALLSGQGGAASLLASARGRARRIAPNLYSDGSLDYNDELTQSMLRGSALDTAGGAAGMVRRLQFQMDNMKRQTAALQSGGSAAGVMNVRADTGIDLQIKSLQDYADALDKTNAANKGTVDTIDKLIAKLKEEKQAFDAIRPANATARINADIGAQVKELNDQTALLKGGASDDDLSYAKNLDALTKRVQLSGSNMSPSEIASQARIQTDAIKAHADALEQNKDAAANATEAINTFSDDIGKLVLSGKNAHDVLLGIGRDFSQMGIKDFLVQPAEKMLKGLLMRDERPSGASGGGVLSFLTPSGGGGWLSKLFGGTPSGAAAAATASQTIASATQTLANATITITNATVIGGGSGGGSGGANYSSVLSMFSGSGGDMAGATSYASLLGGSAATSGALAAGGADYATLLAAGAIAMHSGGVVGRDFSHIAYVNPDVFRGARRYHMGGLLGDEVPIIAQKGERVLSRQEVANGAGGGTTVHVHGPLMHINSPDATGFRKTGGQAASQVLDHLNRVGRRNS